MKNQRKIAITIVSKFRDNLDRNLRPKEMSEEDLMSDVQRTIEAATPESGYSDIDLPSDFKESFKKIICKTRSSIYDSQIKIYDKMLPTIVDHVMSSLESYFLENYSETELEEISLFIESSAGMKMISDSQIFLLLNDQRDKLRNYINDEIDNNIATKKMNEEISELLTDLTLRWTDDTNGSHDHDEW